MGDSQKHGQVYEEIHEGQEGHEENRHRQGQTGEVFRVPRNEEQDLRGLEEKRPEKEQGRQNCLQKGVGCREEELREEWLGQMDQGSERSAQGHGNQGIPSRRREVGKGPGLVEEGSLLVQEVSPEMVKCDTCNLNLWFEDRVGFTHF